ncbi:hypothetical protein [Rubrobacter xylanophilus]|uniref:hypothetical protein n=1 Tax=Rubrobacter xylanophilus TaxID=49319 RepID=UPI0012EA09B3|nr:hypothetical protein [Rubrobacter xylanophilus]
MLLEVTNVHLDRGYNSKLTCERLRELGLGCEISGKGKSVPFWATYGSWICGTGKPPSKTRICRTL